MRGHIRTGAFWPGRPSQSVLSGRSKSDDLIRTFILTALVKRSETVVGPWWWRGTNETGWWFQWSRSGCSRPRNPLGRVWRRVVPLLVVQEKQREHPQDAADGHADGFALQGQKVRPAQRLWRYQPNRTSPCGSWASSATCPPASVSDLDPASPVWWPGPQRNLQDWTQGVKPGFRTVGCFYVLNVSRVRVTSQRQTFDVNRLNLILETHPRPARSETRFPRAAAAETQQGSDFLWFKRDKHKNTLLLFTAPELKSHYPQCTRIYLLICIVKPETVWLRIQLCPSTGCLSGFLHPGLLRVK